MESLECEHYVRGTFSMRAQATRLDHGDQLTIRTTCLVVGFGQREHGSRSSKSRDDSVNAVRAADRWSWCKRRGREEKVVKWSRRTSV